VRTLTVPTTHVNRRAFLTTLTAALAAVAHVRKASGASTRPPRILFRSSWQTVNIGDIGHTPGILRLLGEYLPEAEVTLWPTNVGNGVEEMLKRNFPKLRFAKSAEEVKTAFTECDFLLHGSGSGFVAEKHVAQWREQTGKPYGIYGITLTGLDEHAADLINGARFIFFRDSVSLQTAKEQGLKCPVMEFAPDGAFGVNLRNDEPAIAFLKANGLEEGKFLCVIPRYRYTPYWLIRHKAMTAEDDRKSARNEEMKEHDHAPLRNAIIAVTRQSPMKVLICPEDETQVAIGKAMLYDPLPDDVKAKTVWRDKYWLTDEALSTYVRSAGLFGNEMHSPIMCIGNGIPAIVCRFTEQTNKGFMWRDIGLGDWLFDLDQESEVARIVPTVLSLALDQPAAKAKAATALAFVKQRQRETMEIVRKSLPA
jgi:hypothetical protein